MAVAPLAVEVLDEFNGEMWLALAGMATNATSAIKLPASRRIKTDIQFPLVMKDGGEAR